ncbi:MAG: ZPR1 zinc finger domain-containing protein [archaeon]
MKKKFSMAIDCPSCGKKAVMTELIRKIPNFGKILLTNLNCRECGFNLNDVMNAGSGKPMKYEVEVNSVKDLKTKIVKSSTSSVEVPELGISLYSGSYSEGYITNIEGFLLRTKEALSSLMRLKDTPEKEMKRIEELRKKICKAVNAEISFRVILEDAQGNGALIGRKVKKIELKKKKPKT